MDASLVGRAAGLAVTLVVIVALVLGAFFVHSGRHRAALVASALPLALVPLTLAVSLGSQSLIDTFAGMAVTGTGRMAVATAGKVSRVPFRTPGLATAVTVGASAKNAPVFAASTKPDRRTERTDPGDVF